LFLALVRELASSGDARDRERFGVQCSDGRRQGDDATKRIDGSDAIADD